MTDCHKESEQNGTTFSYEPSVTPEELARRKSWTPERLAGVGLPGIKFVIDLESKAPASTPHGEARLVRNAHVVIFPRPPVTLEHWVKGENERFPRPVVVSAVLCEGKTFPPGTQ